MKVFVAGSRTVKELDDTAKAKLLSIARKGYEVLIGDCYGVDTAVQHFLSDLGYRNVKVFASNGNARNNVGNWPIISIPANDSKRDFDYYQQKDIAMARAADCGFMIWDGKSRGTLSNTINLVSEQKTVLLYIPTTHQTFVFHDIKDLCNTSDSEFAEQILANMVTEGIAVDTLLAEFKKRQAKVRPAVEAMIREAESVANGSGEYFTYDDVFGTDVERS